MKKETTNQKLDRIIKLLEDIKKGQTVGIYTPMPYTPTPPTPFGATGKCQYCGEYLYSNQLHNCHMIWC